MYYKYNDSFWNQDKVLFIDKSTVFFNKISVTIIIFITDRLFINCCQSN